MRFDLFSLFSDFPDFPFGAGSREILCKNESAEVLRATIAAMMYTRDRFLLCSEGDSSTAKAEETFEILHFSKRCLMPWIGIGYAMRAAKGSKDAGMLVKLLSWADFFLDMELKDNDAQAAWKRVLDIAMQGVARLIFKATRLPEFSQMSAASLEKIVGYAEDDEWSEELEIAVSLAGYPRSSGKSPTTSRGACLDYCFKSNSIAVMVRTDTDVMPDVVTLGKVKLAFMKYSITHVASEGQDNITKRNVEADQLVPTCDEETRSTKNFSMQKLFEHGNPPQHKFLFRNQITKIHKQCWALVSFCAGTAR